MLKPKITINRNTHKEEQDMGKSRSNMRVFSDLTFFLPVSIAISCLIVIVLAFTVPSSVRFLKDSVRSVLPGYTQNLRNVAEEQTKFADLSADSKYFDSIAFLNNKGVVKGYGDGTFKVNNTITRAELVKTVVNAKNQYPLDLNYSNCFDDVGNEWFASSVCFAKEKGWITGIDNSFNPNSPLTKAEALKIMLVAFDIKSFKNVEVPDFQDVPETAWYYPYVATAVQRKIISEDPLYDFYKPNASITRGDAFQILYRIMVL
ncbi:hypothetical protein GF376_00565 [Candidatus Peregrinibacteria bacterium]|nr:hypothetical protein [Candidatus Peregrinibacteria bacterium]